MSGQSGSGTRLGPIFTFCMLSKLKISKTIIVCFIEAWTCRKLCTYGHQNDHDMIWLIQYESYWSTCACKDWINKDSRKYQNNSTVILRQDRQSAAMMPVSLKIVFQHVFVYFQIFYKLSYCMSLHGRIIIQSFTVTAKLWSIKSD